MCLAVPARLVKCELAEAVADLHGNQVRISTALVPDAKVGDWVLVHAGFALQRVEEEEAKEIWDVMKDVEKAQQAAEAEMKEVGNE